MFRVSPILLGFLVLLSPFSSTVQADPCGMIPPPPPPYLKKTTLIERVGAQKTYVFYKNGIESFVLRPGFKGKVSNFGMLIPFPSPPAIRKVPNEIFSHIAAAVDPPEVVVTVARRRWRGAPVPMAASAKSDSSSSRAGSSLSIHQVRVVRQEAVGMYQVAVLQAGSPMALKRWMKRNGYMYPKGMDKVCYEYIRARWTFVAVKARVAGKKNLSPRPGMRRATANFPKGGMFTGKVQAMGFRFRTRKLVVPMRLSAFNAGKLRNIVYLLTTNPKRINRIDKKFVMRQMSGKELYRNVTEPLPLRVRGGTIKMINKWRWKQAQRLRNPAPHNGHAKDLFASDLMAVRKNKLALKHEEEKKVLLRIEERLRLRGKHIDKLNQQALRSYRRRAVRSALQDLRRMTLTVVDGDFPRKIIAAANLTFSTYRMPRKCNSNHYYNARTLRRASCSNRRGNRGWGQFYNKRGPYYKGFAATKQNPRKRRKIRGGRYYFRLIKQLSNPKKANRLVAKLVRAGNRAIPYLFGEAIEGNRWTRRGWSIVALSEMKGDKVKRGLFKITKDGRQHMLVRNWSAAAYLRHAQSTKEMTQILGYIGAMPALKRPYRMRLMDLLRKDPNPAGMLFGLASRNNMVHNWIRPMLTSQSTAATLTQMLRGKDLPTRRTAASYASAKMRADNLSTMRAYLKMMKPSSNAQRTPWDGGALYLPGWPTKRLPRWNVWAWRRRINLAMRRNQANIPTQLRNIASQYEKAYSNWLITFNKKQEANKHITKLSRRMIRYLLAWGIWADKRKKHAEKRKILLNLRSWQLKRAALLNINNNATLEQWLLQWHRLAGAENQRKLLAEAGVQGDKNYTAAGIQERIRQATKRFQQHLNSIYMGCFRYQYYDRSKIFTRYMGYTYSVPVCRTKCAKAGYRFASLYAGYQCRCDHTLRRAIKQSENMCRSRCSRSPKYPCGSSYHVSVYSSK